MAIRAEPEVGRTRIGHAGTAFAAANGRAAKPGGTRVGTVALDPRKRTGAGFTPAANLAQILFTLSR